MALFASPFIIGLLLFKVYPVTAGLCYSFTNFHVGSYQPVKWVGLQNYRTMFASGSLYWTAVRNTLWMVVIVVPAQVLWALFVAWVVIRIKRGTSIYRTIYFLPAMIPLVASALAFTVMLNPVGQFNTFLGWLGIKGPGWFGDPSWSKPSLLIMALWGCGKVMILVLAGMLDVPRSLYEAAAIDGARARHQFWHITLPGISPVIFFVLVIGMISAFQYFTEAFVVSSAGNNDVSADQQIGYPQNSLLFYGTSIYQQGFVFFKTGYASAMAWLLFLVIMAFTGLFVWGSKRWVYYSGSVR